VIAASMAPFAGAPRRPRAGNPAVLWSVRRAFEDASTQPMSFLWPDHLALLWAVPHDRLNLVAWGDDLGRYTFGKGAIAHRFCRTCGIHPFAEDAGEGSERSAYINLNCLEEVDLATIEVFDFDGRSA